MPPVASIDPGHGTTVTATTDSIPFTLTVPNTRMGGVFAEISTQNVPGQDGTLADDYRVGTVEMVSGDAEPSVYRGTAYGQGYSGSWTNKPGTYYWQVTGYDRSSFRRYVGPVWAFSIAVDAAAPSEAERAYWRQACRSRACRVTYLLRRVRTIQRALDIATTRRATRRLRSRLRRVRRQLSAASRSANRACDRADALGQ